MVMARLLIVENERIIAWDLAKRLTKLGYTVVAIVGSGREAVQQAGDLRPDLVLMDIGLHGKMDGLEAAMWQRRATALMGGRGSVSRSRSQSASRPCSRLSSWRWRLSPELPQEIDLRLTRLTRPYRRGPRGVSLDH
jgi:hypothetical protein